MPVYEYYCGHCDGIFEALRSMSRASEGAPCPVCAQGGERIMPTSIAAFTLRDGYPRRLPDKGTYWHLGKEVKSRIKGRARPFEHPELARPKSPPRPSKGERAIEGEKQRLREGEFRRMRASGVAPAEARLPRSLRQPRRPR
jgi:putative FmdB family regulatory protein